MAGFSPAQIAQLLKPIAGQRVLQDGKGHSHVSQQDVTAHLIRMFGFGSFDTEVLSIDCVFERERTDKDGKPAGRFDVCYRSLMRLTVRDEHGQKVASYEDGSTATAQNQTLGDAHDLAYKSAISLAKKRCAINLGDQFGLSLYNKGQTNALVIATLVGAGEGPDDIEAQVPQQVTLGNDETDYDPTAEASMSSASMSSASTDASVVVADLMAVVQELNLDAKTTAAEFAAWHAKHLTVAQAAKDDPDAVRGFTERLASAEITVGAAS